ncbi:Phosphoserine phosphatase RsbU [Nonomuraea coxensis DSM 45129]|uniref:Phosphoserine phosphatase RsbU n=1 Tax=Nonomuraea coxensis DSM 45129 TaxID=1122611 RepID=A0ABX8U3K5_9ACTN|nr:SpoIIE family protein phosphatase [Nonomuraea coxensis]QYC42317.1 Phosphoserine phosphatase RsbU [Nonomuraea coxensis DSM 45129]
MARPGDSGSIPGAAIASSRLDDLLIEAVFSVGAHLGAVYVLDPGDELLAMEVSIGAPADTARVWARLRLSDPAPVTLAVRERRLVWLGDRVAMARAFPAAALALPYHFGVAAVPLCAGGAVWGALVLGWPTGGESELPRRPLDVMDDVGARMGRLLRQAHARGQPVVPHPLPRLLNPVRAHAPGPYAGLTALSCLSSLPEGYCHLDGRGQVTLVTAAAAELLACRPSELVGKRFSRALPWLDDPVHEDRYRAAVLSHRPTAFTARRPDGRLLSFRCYPSVPGVTLRITPADAPGTAGEDAGGRAGVTGLHDVLHLATALARATTARDVADLVADRVLPACEAQAMAILTWDSGRIRVVAARGYGAEALESFHGRPIGQATDEGHDGDEGTPAFYGSPDELRAAYPDTGPTGGMNAWTMLPLVALGRSIGTCLLAWDRPHEFGEGQRAMLSAIGGLVTQAFERAWLYDHKHQLAQSLQSSLLPKDLPEFPGLEVAARYVPLTPGMDIGGDFYDLIRLDDCLAAAVIGDVQGHDMTAAALMGQARTAIRAHAAAGASPGEVLSRTNQLLTAQTPDRFTSCLYVAFDLRRRVALLASAGHLPPVLGLLGAPAEVIDPSSGLLLGIDPDAEYVTTTVNVPPGATLALYTDGLVEKPGGDLSDGIAALAARFTPAPGRPLDDLADDLIAAAGEEDRRTDDSALLLLRSAAPGGCPPGV